jgi:two-component sensor histidine kinase
MATEDNSILAHMSQPLSPPPPEKRKFSWRLAIFFILWTVLVATALGWLTFHEPTSSSFVARLDGNDARSWFQRLSDWAALAKFNFYWVLPWILFGPYLLWLGARFHLQRAGAVWRTVALLCGGAVFIMASSWVDSRLVSAKTEVVAISVSVSGNVAIEDGRTSMFTNVMPDMAQLVRSLQMNQATKKVIETKITSISTNSISELKFSPRELFTNQGIIKVFEADKTSPFTIGIPDSAQLPQGWPTNQMPLTNHLDLPRVQMMNDQIPPHAGIVRPGLDALAFITLIGLANVGVLHRRFREREQQAVLLESHLNQARLQALQAQLQPHFLFNTLNGIATLVRRDPAAAEEMITSLSELLRLALNQSARQEILLRDELEFLKRYLEIQQMRFHDRLKVEQSVEPSALDCAVPALLLQPLVENAIRHGIEPSPAPGKVWIGAARDGARLVLTIEDNGVGLKENSDSTGIGLANVRARLVTLYPRDHEFQFGPREGGGVKVRISIPWVTMEETVKPSVA